MLCQCHAGGGFSFGRYHRKIGPKAGILDLEPVTDEATGKEIRSASVTLRRAANPDSFLSASTTQGRVFVPAFAEVLIEISAEGYKLWPSPAKRRKGRST